MTDDKTTVGKAVIVRSAAMRFVSNSPDETYRFGCGLAEMAGPGDVYLLRGDLGAGKTLLVKGFAKGLGVDDIVTSPTFTILQNYSGRLPLHHFDLYRMTDPDEAEELGFTELIYGGGISMIEWPDVICEMLPENKIDIFIERTDGHDGERIIEIVYPGEKRE